MIRHIFFDLDGTLSDPFDGITLCIRFALEQMGREAPLQEELAWCIGPPLHLSFRDLLQTDSDDLCWEAVMHYRTRFGEVGMFENRLYDGVERMLSALRRDGFQLYVASSKPLPFVSRIVSHFGLSGYFSELFGSGLDGSLAGKEELLAFALDSVGTSADACVMVGDRGVDVAAGRALGMRTVGVLYGYGSREELEAAGAEVLVDSPFWVVEAVQGMAAEL